MEAIKILDYIYIETILMIIVFSEVFKKYVPTGRLHPKWQTLIVAVLVGGIGYGFKELFFSQPLDLTKYILSIGFSNLAYDYFWKPIRDKFITHKDPLNKV